MKKELLAPAGDFETLKQAIHNGADAVYLGGKRFGARKFASNFDNEEMVKAIKYCHLYGVKIYVTVNTIIYENEVDDYLEYLKFLHQNGVDAVIMQDLGMISLVRKVLPNLEIHVSTQAHTHNKEQIKLLEELGVKRVVFAREMSLTEINSIDTKLEIEAFIHGALCVCYSGQCLFSSMLLNRSGNRGECAGICRLPFELYEDDKKVDTNGKYLLSPKELNTTSHIKELLSSNITSFKIEGRMKSPETIGFITRMYRNLIDHYLNGEEIELTKEENKKLLVLFNREYTDGYLFNKSKNEIMNIKSPNHVGIKIGEVVEVTDKKIKIKLEDDLNQEDGIRFKNSNLGMIANFIYDKKDNLINGASSGSIIYLDNKVGLTKNDFVYKTIDSKLLEELDNYDLKRIGIDISASIDNDKFILEISDGINRIIKSDSIVEEAINNGTSKDRIIEQLSKLGNTPFKVNSIDVNLNGNVFIPISKLNELRRSIIDELVDLRESSKKEVIINDIPKVDKITNNNDIKISVLVRNKEQLEACLDMNIDYIYVVDEELYDKYSDNKNIYLRLDRVNNKFEERKNDRLLIGEIGSINKYVNDNVIVGDYYLNVVNSYNVDYLRKIGINRITLSIENTIDRIKDIVANSGNNNLEVLVYGRLEAMVTKYDIISMLTDEKGSKYYLKDRNKSLYPLVRKNNLTHIFYYKNYDILEDIPKLEEIGINNYQVSLFDENREETVKLIEKVKGYFKI